MRKIHSKFPCWNYLGSINTTVPLKDESKIRKKYFSSCHNKLLTSAFVSYSGFQFPYLRYRQTIVLLLIYVLCIVLEASPTFSCLWMGKLSVHCRENQTPPKVPVFCLCRTFNVLSVLSSYSMALFHTLPPCIIPIEWSAHFRTTCGFQCPLEFQKLFYWKVPGKLPKEKGSL